MPQTKSENILTVHTEHVKYSLMDYCNGKLDEHERYHIELHLNSCFECQEQYKEISDTSAVLRKNIQTMPAVKYYSTILPRVRRNLVHYQHIINDYGKITSRIIIPITASLVFIALMINISMNSVMEYRSSNGLRQVINAMSADEIIQIVAHEYVESMSLAHQDINMMEIAEHFQGDLFIRDAVSKEYAKDIIADLDIEGTLSELSADQVEQLLSKLSERTML